MSIVALPLPYQIAAGQLEDAAPVMGNYNYIAAQVNANAVPNGSKVFVQGTSTTNFTSGVNTIIGTQSPTKLIDTLSEFNTSTGKFTPTVAGYYAISCASIQSKNGATITLSVGTVLKTGATYGVLGGVGIVGIGQTNPSMCGMPVKIVHMGLTDYLQFAVEVIFTGGPVQIGSYEISIWQVG